MRTIEATAFSINALRITERPVPEPRRGEILVRIHAASLNYRDIAVLSGKYMPSLQLPYIPVSDGCGTVVAVGEGVTRFAVGHRVTPTYTQGWHSGNPSQQLRAQSTLGAPLPGVLQEYIVIPAEDAVTPPEHLSDIEAATLPIAALTAWSTLADGALSSGSTVLVQGTGGVALFALQFARCAGARVVALTSSDIKAERLRKLGAETVINYRTTPEWAQAVREATDGRGADIIVETTGSTLPKSMAAAAFGGFIGVVGFVGGYETAFNIRQLLGPKLRIQGISVGSRERFEAMNRAIVMHGLHPVVDSSFPLEKTAEAFRKLERGEHFGKITISLV